MRTLIALIALQAVAYGGVRFDVGGQRDDDRVEALSIERAQRGVERTRRGARIFRQGEFGNVAAARAELCRGRSGFAVFRQHGLVPGLVQPLGHGRAGDLLEQHHRVECCLSGRLPVSRRDNT